MEDTNTTAEIGGFSAMLKKALGPLVDQQAKGFVEMMAEDAVMEFPYAPPGVVRKLVGRAALADHLQRIGGMIDFTGFSQPVVHRTENPEIVILEFTCDGTIPATGRPYQQHYISVITLRDGRIIHYLDYWNPLVVLDAMGGTQPQHSSLQETGQ